MTFSIVNLVLVITAVCIYVVNIIDLVLNFIIGLKYGIFCKFSYFYWCKVPSTMANTQSLTTIRNTQAPITIINTWLPTTITSTQSPATITSTQSPATITSTTSPATITSTQSPTITSTQSPSTITSTQSPATITSTQSPATITSTQSPTTIKNTQSPTTITSTQSPATITSIQPPAITEITTTDAVTNAPTGTPPKFDRTKAALLTMPAVASRRPPITLPPVQRICLTCGDSALDICEYQYEETQCNPPDNYCMNIVTNSVTGTRTVERKCTSFNDCYSNWWQGSSDEELCQTYTSDVSLTANFQCSFCCTENKCNEDIKPPKNTLYRDN